MTDTSRSSASLLAKALLIIIFVGYIFKYFELLYYINNTIYIGDTLPEWQFINYIALKDSFSISIAALVLITPILTYFIFSENRYMPPPGYRLGGIFPLLLFLGLGFLAALRIQLGATMGEASSNLPWYIGTLVYRSQGDLMPGLLVFLIHGYRINNQRTLMYISIAALFILQALIGVASGSKSGVIFFGFVMICYWELVADRRYLRPRIIVPLVLAAMVAFIAGSQVRSLALLGTSSQYVVDFLDGRLLSMTVDVFTAIVNRFPGQEALALACNNGCSAATLSGVLPIDRMLSGEIALYYTRDVVGVTSDYDFRSPGFLGGSVMALGIYGGVLTSIAAIAIALFAMRAMDRAGLSVAARVVAAFGFFRFFMEGAWYWADLASVAYGVIGTELAVRFAVSSTRRSQMSGLDSGPGSAQHI